jgi:hypothetical protein
MGVIAPQILDEDVRRVWLRREAIIANIYPGISDGKPVRVDGVESVSVLWLGL